MAKKKKKAAKKATAKPKAKPKLTRWTDVPEPVLRWVLETCDGHTIFKPESFVKHGVPKKLVDAYTEIFESDFSDHKATIFDNKTGKPINAMRGLYGLQVLTGIVRDFGLMGLCKDFFGRGSQAREYIRVMTEHLDNLSKKKD